MARALSFLNALEHYATAAGAQLGPMPRGERGKRWLAYSSAVGSALALAASADAGIIYSGSQNVSVAIGKSNGFASSLKRFTIVPGFQETLILTHFRRSAASGSTHAMFFHQLLGHTAPVNLDTSAGVRRLASGQVISAGARDGFGARVLLHNATHPSSGPSHQGGPWGATTTGFVGFRYLDAGNQYHFGWIRLQLKGVNALTTPDPASLTAVDWAYQDTAGTPILAGDKGASGVVPEPAGLALAALATGAAGVWALRRRRGQRPAPPAGQEGA